MYTERVEKMCDTSSVFDEWEELATDFKELEVMIILNSAYIFNCHPSVTGYQ